MKKKLVLTLLLLLTTQNVAFAKDNEAIKPRSSSNVIQLISIYEDFERFIQTNQDLTDSFIGIYIKNLSKKETLYQYNANKLFTPASNTKIFTTLLALEKLGENYTFKTTLATDEYHQLTPKEFEIKNLYINFSGDPTLKKAHLENMFKELKAQGITKINGDIILNRGIFDNIFYGPGWMWDDMDSCDSSPIDAIYLDDNCIKTNESEQSILKPEEYVSAILRPLTKDLFNYEGNFTITDKNEKNSLVLVQNTSIELKEILKRFNKESHNLTGELLLKTIGLRDFEKDSALKGSTKKGTEVMSKYLVKEFQDTNFNIVDGSGLSRYNLITPKLIMNVLEKLYEKETFRNVVFKAFPLGGVEGTLKNRLKNILNYQVIAKSGSMSGVNCLSGYLVKEGKDIIAFSIMINNSKLAGKNLRDIQDKLLENLINSL